jgi:hypothetical protein
MRLRPWKAAAFLLSFCLSGCIELNAPETLLPIGTSFVVRGTAAIVDNGGPCLIWLADNGLAYYLYQDPSVDNDTFDRATTPGATSRLEIAVRNDLIAPCLVDVIVEVQDVLEIVD